jgi:competence protein ComEA
MNTFTKGSLLSLAFVAAPLFAASPYDTQSTTTPSAASSPASAAAQVDLNSATQAQLQTLPGLNARDATAIVNYRSKNGSFKTVDDLKNVPGFNAKKVAAIKSQVSVSGAASTMDQSPAMDSPSKQSPSATPPK